LKISNKKVFTFIENGAILLEVKNVNIPDEELERFKKIIEFKGQEIVVLTDKVKSIDNLNNQLNKILKGKSCS
jgi:hypothetical protein